MIKKNLICVISIILMLLLPSISANNYSINDGVFSVKTNSNQLLEMVPRESKVEKIFDNMDKKMGNAITQEEYKIVFKETLFELEKYSLLNDISAIDAYKIICDSYDEGNIYFIYGESVYTYFLGTMGIIFFEYFKKYNTLFIYTLYQLISVNEFQYKHTIFHKNSYIIFGFLISRDNYVYGFNPAEGYIKVNSSDGQTDYNGCIFGHSDYLLTNIIYDNNNPDPPRAYVIYCIGVKGFKGIHIGNYYFGTAKEVNIGYDAPNIQ